MPLKQTLTLAFGVALIGMTATLAQQFGPATFDLSWNTVDSGGGTSIGGTLQVIGTIGQSDATAITLTGGIFEIRGGFWPGGVIPVPDCPPDISPQPNGDGVVNIDDLLLVINQWGVAGGPADINHDNIVNIDDLLAVITTWGLCP